MGETISNFYRVHHNKLDQINHNDIVCVYSREGSIHENALINYDGETTEEKFVNLEADGNDLVCVVLLPTGEQLFY